MKVQKEREKHKYMCFECGEQFHEDPTNKIVLCPKCMSPTQRIK